MHFDLGNKLVLFSKSFYAHLKGSRFRAHSGRLTRFIVKILGARYFLLAFWWPEFPKDADCILIKTVLLSKTGFAKL